MNPFEHTITRTERYPIGGGAVRVTLTCSCGWARVENNAPMTAAYEHTIEAIGRKIGMPVAFVRIIDEVSA